MPACRLCVAHPHIVQFREIFLSPGHLAIVMEFAAGGDMFDFVIRNKGSGQPLLRCSTTNKSTGTMPMAADAGFLLSTASDARRTVI